MFIFLAAIMTLWPLIYAGGVLLIAWLDPRSADEVLLAFALVYLAVTIPLCILYLIFGQRNRKDDAHTMLTGWNIAIKTVSNLCFAAMISAIILYWIDAHIATQNGALEAFLGVFLLILLVIPWSISNFMLQLATAIQCNRVIRADPRLSRWHVLLHMVPVIDLVSAICVYRKQKQRT